VSICDCVEQARSSNQQPMTDPRISSADLSRFSPQQLRV
jgi:hypothetical protein